MFSSALQVGDTALHMASQNGHEEVVRLLLQSGVKDVTNKVCSASIITINYSHIAILTLAIYSITISQKWSEYLSGMRLF